MPAVQLWDSSLGLLISSIGVIMVLLSIIGTTRVNISLRETHAKLTELSARDQGSLTLEEALEYETLHVLVLEMVSTSILFKLIQSVGIAYFASALFCSIAIVLASSSLSAGLGILFANASFFLFLLSTLLICIAYMYHRLNEGRLKQLQEKLNYLRLRHLTRLG